MTQLILKTLIQDYLKQTKKSYKNIDIYKIVYITIKKIDDHENVNSINPLYLMIGEVIRHIEKKVEVNIQFLIQLMKTKKYYKDTKDGIKNEIETINSGSDCKYGKDFIKICHR